MMKKKDKLFELLKNPEKYPIMKFLSIKDLQSLALVRKSYYLQINAQIQFRQLDQRKNHNQKSQSTLNKQIKYKNNCKQKQYSDSQSIEQTLFTIQKFNINKWPKNFSFNTENWHKIDKLPFHNNFLQKKINNNCYIFYKQNQSQNLIYINRSLVDPNLDFSKGSFNHQLQQDIYEHMHQQTEIELDFSSREMLLKRQKQMLEKINMKKAQQQQKGLIFYEKQLQKAINIKRYAIILCFGGSFSLGIYQKSKCISHQSDKKYVCRKKAGQRQFNRDKQSGSSIKSMGSQIRRQQQKKHVINVNQILNQNKEELFQCDIIFLQAPGMNRLYIINENQTMAQLQQKLRSVCLTAKKANFTQVSSINQVINTVHWVKVNSQDKHSQN